MFRRTKVCSAAILTLGGTLVMGSSPAFGQAQQLERVEITGSSVRRIDAESALPVQILKREDIQRSGVTSTVDLLSKLSVIQGATGESASTGGQTFGFSGVSIHNIGETRTLVLLNGRRLSLFGGQTFTGFAAGFDLNAIPISSIERVEILTDGASALYGADAIAGVVNLITRRDSTEGDVTIGISHPRAGAEEKRLSATKGFGSMQGDGFNVNLTFAHDERTQLRSVDREFAKTGRLGFDYNGKHYLSQQFSPSPIPANATDDDNNLISPYLKVNKKCPPKTFRIIDGTDDYCGFDFVAELEIYPERKRDTFFGSGAIKLGDQELFGEVLLSRTTQKSAIAPVPGSINIPAGTPLHDKYLLPLGITKDSLAFYRVFDLGGRTTDDKADFYNFAGGARGLIGGWDYVGTASFSQSDVKGNIAGYPGALALSAVRKSGLLDPFVLPGQQSAAGLAALQKTNYQGYWDGGTAKLTTIALTGSRELTTMPAGPLLLGTGVNYNIENYESKPSLFAQGLLADPVAGTLCDPNNADVTKRTKCDTRFGDAAATQKYSANRHSYGLFGELVIPILKTLEFTASARHDNFSDFGNADTIKGAFRWNAMPNLLIRGSVGTGFHAPTVPQVNASLQAYGVTSDKFRCGAAATTQAQRDLATIAASLNAQCQTGNRQYDVIAGGNKNLQPEKSTQGTLGIRFEPNTSLSLGADLWHVEIKDSFGQIAEAAVFANPLLFPTSWTTKKDIGTGVTYLALQSDNRNLGKQFSTGIDFDFTGRTKLDFGDLTSQFTMTYMIREDQQLLKDGQYFSAIGNDSKDLGVQTFRWQGRWTNTVKTVNWAHTVGINFKSGYTDRAVDADRLDASGNVVGTEKVQLDVSQYLTMDLQSQWTPRKDVSVTLGVLNVFDSTPPLALGTSGNNRGQQFGYDNRYYDSRGRTLYANISYKF